MPTDGPVAAPPRSRPFAEFSLSAVSSAPRKLPNRAVLHATEGWGKTSFAAQAPSPIFLMTRSETGLWKLQEEGQLPEKVAHFPRPAESWLEVKAAISELVMQKHDYKTLVVDTLGGAERLLHEYICDRDFSGDWGERGFGSFDKGARINSIPEYIAFLGLLDRLRDKGMSILLLCHTVVKTFKNPEGPDYDRYIPALHQNTWMETHKWADLVLFGSREVHVDTQRAKDAKGKARGGTDRILYTERSAAYDAKNRHGLPEEIECGGSAAEAWQNFIAAMKAKK